MSKIIYLFILFFIFSCDESSNNQNDIYGCTDPTANNFDEYANIDDQSCQYDEELYFNLNIEETGESTLFIFQNTIQLELGVETFVNPAGEMLWREGLYCGSKPNVNSGLRTVETQKMFNFVSNIINSGKAENILFRKRK